MNCKKTMWALGLCATLVLPVVANAAVICPTGDDISCSGTPVICSGTAVSSLPATGVSCQAGFGVSATCNGGASGNLVAFYVADAPLPTSCTWSCQDGDDVVDCVIDQDDGLPVTLQKFSVD